MGDKLKPCPFCGGVAFIFEMAGFGGEYSVQCGPCGAAIGGFENKLDAIEAWESRSRETSIRAEARAEAAEKAVAFVKGNTGIGYGNINALRNAIFADEPKEE